MTTQFPEFYGSPVLPDRAVCGDMASPVPQPAPDFTSGTPDGYALVVQPEDVAKVLRLPRPLDTDAADVLTEAIRSAQADVVQYLGRPVVPLTYTETGLLPSIRGWHLKNYPVHKIVSWTAETGPDSRPSGRYTVTYIAGLDTVNDPDLFPIVRFIKLHACYDPFAQVLFRERRPDIATRVTSGSTDGQSATVTDALPAPANSGRMSTPAAVNAQMSLPGSPPTLQTLDKWRIGKRRVYQRPRVIGSAAPWPYDIPDPATIDVYAGVWQTWW